MAKVRFAENYQHPSIHVYFYSSGRIFGSTKPSSISMAGGDRPSMKTANLATAFKLGEIWYKKQLRASDTERREHAMERLTTNPTIGELYASYKAELPKKHAGLPCNEVGTNR